MDLLEHMRFPVVGHPFYAFRPEASLGEKKPSKTYPRFPVFKRYNNIYSPGKLAHFCPKTQINCKMFFFS